MKTLKKLKYLATVERDKELREFYERVLLEHSTCIALLYKAGNILGEYKDVSALVDMKKSANSKRAKDINRIDEWKHELFRFLIQHNQSQ